MSKGNNTPKGNNFRDIIAAAQRDTLQHIHPLVKFSFKYLSSTNTKFNYTSYSAAYFLEFLERLKNVSLMQMKDLLTNRSASLRCHPIDWNGTSEACFGIPNEAELAAKPYQFSLSANEYGRVHGFIIDTQFFVVWLDKDHALYPSK